MLPATRRWRSFWPFGPIFSLELRQQARRPQTYGLRVIYLCLLLAFLSFAWASITSDRRGTLGVAQLAQRRAETGRIFFQVFGMFSIIAMHLISPVLTSTAIGAERMKRTLDTLLMTPITAWQIVAGKLMSRLWTAIMLLALSLPLLALVRLLGGVEVPQLIGTLCLCIATALGSAAIGLLLSCLINRAWAVVLLSYFIEFSVYFLLPVFVSVIYATQSRRPPSATFLSAVNPVSTTGMILFGRGFVTASWWPAVTVQVGLALILTLIAARLLRRRTYEGPTSDSAPPPLPQGTVVHANLNPPTISADAALPLIERNIPPHASRDVGDYPVLWHELQQSLMHRLWKRVVGVTFIVGMLGLSYVTFWISNALKEWQLQIGYAIIMQGMLLLTAVVISATCIANEKESDTWTLLIATPLSAASILYGKFLGITRRLMWPWLAIVAHFALFASVGVIAWQSFVIVMWTSLTFNMMWIATGVYLSLRCRRATTAVVLNLLLPMVAFLGVPMILSSLQSVIQPDERRTWYEVAYYYLPFFYGANGMSRPLATDSAYLNSFMLPMTSTRLTLNEFLLVAIGSGIVQLLVTWLMLKAACGQFNRIVGRAD